MTAVPVDPAPIPLVLLLKVNSHRHMYDGRICERADEFDCGAQESFRIRHCAVGDRLCIHIDLFNDQDPHFYIDQGPAESAFLAREREFLGSLAVLVAPSHRGGLGIDRKDRRFYAVGWFVIGQLRRETIRSRDWWCVRPRESEWVRFLVDRVDVTRFRRLSIPLEESGYVRKLAFEDSSALLSEIRRQHEIDIESLPVAQAERCRRIVEMAESLRSRLIPPPAPPPTRLVTERHPLPRDVQEALRKHRALAPSTVAERPVTAIQPVTKEVAVEAALPAIRDPHPLPEVEPERIDTFFREQGLGYPQGLVARVYRALRAKGFVLLAGPTGTGKTSLALTFPKLFADPDDKKKATDRRLFLVVQPSWHSREEVLGYYNPINDTYVSTPLARLLHDAEVMWNLTREKNAPAPPYFVVLDEFNLAPPEEYFAELLSRLEADEEGRWIELYPPDREETVRRACGADALPPRIKLTPNVFFLATFNDDGAEPPLSPRVLDRAHYIRVPPQPQEVLDVLGTRYAALLEMPKMRNTVLTLVKVLARHDRGLGGRALRDLLEYCKIAGPRDEADLARALDQVVLQRVLPGLHFSALEGEDLDAVEEFLNMLRGGEGLLFLGRCAGVVQRWVERLQEGRDVPGTALDEEENP
ncbi:MAG: AAA family ATPase [Planctomycetota bacterium]